MNKLSSGFLLVFFAFQIFLSAQNAPISTIADTTACPGTSITLPIRVSNFNNIGSLSLKIQYNTNNLTFNGWSNVSGFPSLSLNSSQPGMLVIGGFSFSPGGISLPDHSIFFSITFMYSGGNPSVTWYDNGPSCEWTGAIFPFPVLNDLPNNLYYINGGVAPSLIPDFSANTTLPLLNETVTFTDQSSNASSWLWSITPSGYSFVNGTNPSDPNPQVIFNNSGAYSVTLTVTNGSCVQILQRDDYLHAGTPGLWTGSYSSEWYDERNWHNWVVPNQDVAVVIPSSALFWPEYDGNFIIGSNCYSLTIEGTSGSMTVNGDLIIP